MLGPAHSWDGLRALARLIYGPEDPRVWAALSRSARSLADSASGPDAGEDSLYSGEFRRIGAASMAAGAIAGFRDARPAPPAATLPSPGLAKGKGGGNGEENRAWESTLADEIAFAEETLVRILGSKPTGRGREAPFRTLAEAIYPQGRTGEASRGPFPSSSVLRARLAEAEGSGGPGPGSRDALVLRSLLGAELCDSGGRGALKEALGLLREASDGLDSLVGNRDPDSLAAKERLARRLGGMYGRAGILPQRAEKPARGDAREAVRILDGLLESVPATPEAEPFRKRVCLTSAGLSAWAGVSGARSRLSLAGILLNNKKLDTALAMGRFDLGEFMLRAGKKNEGGRMLSGSLELVRYVLGGRCPEAASPLARAGDILHSSGDNERACAFWAFAIEALEGEGERAEPYVADLELRIGRVLMEVADCAQALPLLSRAEERLCRLWGKRSQQALECAAYLAQICYWTGNMKEAERRYRALAGILDGVPPRSGQDPSFASDEGVLSLALAGLGATMIYRGDRPGGEELVRRSLGIRAGSEADSLVKQIGDMFRLAFLNSDKPVRGIRLEGVDFRQPLRHPRGYGLISIIFSWVGEDEDI
ncbi:MAG: hypothetical protein LBR80_12210 [Deltaproteobacteria bacterium]|jgi:hypothetical protein|nr:hypothetical protein [Deltaproteobacteria bacterium]